MPFIDKDCIATKVFKTDSAVGLAVIKFSVNAFFQVFNGAFAFAAPLFADMRIYSAISNTKCGNSPLKRIFRASADEILCFSQVDK